MKFNHNNVQEFLIKGKVPEGVGDVDLKNPTVSPKTMVNENGGLEPMFKEQIKEMMSKGSVRQLNSNDLIFKNGQISYNESMKKSRKQEPKKEIINEDIEEEIETPPSSDIKSIQNEISIIAENLEIAFERLNSLNKKIEKINKK